MDKLTLQEAYRWLMLNESELETKLAPIYERGDMEMYHKVKMMESAKHEDAFHDTFMSLNFRYYLSHFEALKIDEDEESLEFKNELIDMLNQSKGVWLGPGCRFKIW
jgi:hypothetical protein